MDKHDGMHTIWYGVFVRSTRELRFAVGGHPPAVLVHTGSGGASAEPLRLNGMIVGALPGTTFESRTVTIQPSDCLYVFSDGVYEVTKPDGTMWEFEEFIETLQRTRDGVVVPAVIEAVKQVRGVPDFEDDVSILEVRFAG